ncbi:MAG: helical backbone metal receptor [Syntrophales bacterium]
MKVNESFFLIIFFSCLFFLSTSYPAPAVPPRRIVSLAPNITEILFDLGLGKQIVAVTTYCDYPREALSKPKIGGFANPSLEAIVAARPDLVMLTEDGNPQEIEAKLKKLGIRTYVFRARSIEELPEAIRQVGLFLEIGKRADKKARTIQEQLDRFQGDTAKRSSLKRPKAIFVIQPEPLIVAGPKTAMDEAMSLLGLNNIAGGAAAHYARYSLEETLRQQPQILFVGKSKGMEEDVKKLLKRLRRLDAVENGKVYAIGETLYRLGPRIITGLNEMKAAVDQSGL